MILEFICIFSESIWIRFFTTHLKINITGEIAHYNKRRNNRDFALIKYFQFKKKSSIRNNFFCRADLKRKESKKKSVYHEHNADNTNDGK